MSGCIHHWLQLQEFLHGEYVSHWREYARPFPGDRTLCGERQELRARWLPYPFATAQVRSPGECSRLPQEDTRGVLLLGQMVQGSLQRTSILKALRAFRRAGLGSMALWKLGRAFP